MRGRLLSVAGVTGVLTALIGLSLALGGGWLLSLGGSPYYLLAGVGLVASGVLIVVGRRLGAILYGLLLVGTFIWAMAEVGTDGCALLPRLFAPTVLGLWIADGLVARIRDQGVQPDNLAARICKNDYRIAE